MKFKFCGGADCPDWVLAAINNLSKISSVKLKQFAQVVALGIINPPIKMENAERVLGDSSSTSSGVDVHACAACIAHILTASARFLRAHTASDVLHTELQQLGLPREHSNCLRKILNEHGPAIRATLRAATLTVNPMENVAVRRDGDLKYNVTLTVGGLHESVLVTPFTVDVLLNDLKMLRNKMAELNNTNYFV